MLTNLDNDTLAELGAITLISILVFMSGWAFGYHYGVTDGRLKTIDKLAENPSGFLEVLGMIADGPAKENEDVKEE